MVDGVAVQYELTSSARTEFADVNTAGEKALLYYFKLNALGQLVDIDVVGTTPITGTVGYKITNGVIDSAYSDGSVSVDGDLFNIQSGAVVYKWSTANGRYAASTLNSTNLKLGEYVALYDTDENDVADIVLINPVKVYASGAPTIDTATEGAFTTSTAAIAAAVAEQVGSFMVTNTFGDTTSVSITWVGTTTNVDSDLETYVVSLTGTTGTVPAGFTGVPANFSGNCTVTNTEYVTP
jgi:hypothetical protein